jgi:hypothetical protein
MVVTPSSATKNAPRVRKEMPLPRMDAPATRNPLNCKVYVTRTAEGA